MARRRAATIEALLQRRIVFVAGKGGTGKSTLAAALALVAAGAGKRVLCVEVDAKGDCARALGAEPVGFQPRTVQPNVSVLALVPEESLQEYLRLYFHVPRLARLTPLSRVFDFVATGVPGTREMLVVGKIAYEEKRLEAGRPAWDLVVVDGAATGQVLPQLQAPKVMLELARGGILRSQTEWIHAALTDPARTVLTICALPEEMPVAEAIELHDRAVNETGVAIGACFLNRAFPVPISRYHVDAVHRLSTSDGAAAIDDRFGPGAASALTAGTELGRRLREETERHLRHLRNHLAAPVVEIPLVAAPRPGLAVTKAIAAALGGGLRR